MFTSSFIAAANGIELPVGPSAIVAPAAKSPRPYGIELPVGPSAIVAPAAKSPRP